MRVQALATPSVGRLRVLVGLNGVLSVYQTFKRYIHYIFFCARLRTRARVFAVSFLEFWSFVLEFWSLLFLFFTGFGP